MPLTCPRCSRTNPSEALFCFNDGTVLGDPARRQGIIDPARRRFPMPFVLPSGKVCNTFDELALAIQSDWDASREMLQHDIFSGFFAGLGRADLSRTAREAAKRPDADRALDELLRALPTTVVEPPRLSVEPGKVNLGTLRVGQDVRFDLHISNQGMGLLTGEVLCEEGPWLAVGDAGTRSRKKLFQTLHETTIPIHVSGKSLAAGNKPLVARLLIDTAGGAVQVPVTIEVPVTPFPDGPLGGAITPRQLAQKARDNPNETADLFSNGAVEKWYRSNGWTYPVQEPSAVGVAAVQQFFEALGLTTPPKVTVEEAEIRLEGRGGDIVRASIQVVTEEKKRVYAHATTDADWLTVSEVTLDGRIATVHLRVAEVPDRALETLRATVSIVSNGRQRFKVPVRLFITAPSPVAYRVYEAPQEKGQPQDNPPLPRRPPDDSKVKMRDEPPPIRRRDRDEESRPTKAVIPGLKMEGCALAVLPVLFLTFALMITFVVDLVAWGRTTGVTFFGSGDFAGMPQDLHVFFHDSERDSEEGLLTFEPTMRFGLELTGQSKRLTYAKHGLTNNTVVRLDGSEWIFGQPSLQGLLGKQVPTSGRWLERSSPIKRGLSDGRRSVWSYDEQNTVVTQTVGLVPGSQSGRIDTCYIHYRIDNRDSKEHTVGLRFLLDTYIGENDGVPFLVPGSAQLCNTMREFSTAEVPDFIQARETEDLAKPGTIALIQLKMPGMEPPSRVTLCAWPNPRLGFLCLGPLTRWHVPAFPMKELWPADSAVVIYWDPRPIRPAESREMAFSYGLGKVSAGEAGGVLGLSVGGSFVPGGEFTLTAEAREPQPGQMLTLELPDGFSIVVGSPTQSVPPLAPNASARVSPVTWRVKAGPREGTAVLRVNSSTGVSQTQEVRIRVRGIFGN